MSTTIQGVREQLLAGDAEFKQLVEKHSQYESQLEQLSKNSYLSAEDLLLEAELKKLKLRVKDAMEQRLALAAKAMPD